MTATALVAAALGIVVGIVIGGLGGGGGVLTVPALVYVLGQNAHDATTGGVLIVGVTALVGTLVRVRERGIEWRTGIAFGAVGMPAAYLGTLVNRNVDQPVLLIAFACLTLLAAAAMLWRGDEPPDDPPERRRCGHGRRDPPRGGHRAAVKIVVVRRGRRLPHRLPRRRRRVPRRARAGGRPADADVPRGRDVPVHHRAERRVVGAVAHDGSAPATGWSSRPFTLGRHRREPGREAGRLQAVRHHAEPRVRRACSGPSGCSSRSRASGRSSGDGSGADRVRPPQG